MRTILLVDDDQSVHALLGASLMDNQKYRLLHATDGEEGLAMATRERPDLILLDVYMPKLDGFEVCRTLKSDPATRDIIVILLTAAPHIEVIKQRSCQADGYVGKPFSPHWLLTELDELLEAG